MSTVPFADERGEHGAGPLGQLACDTLAITQGDAAGIGPETIALLFRDAPEVARGCFAAGDVATLRRAAACVARPGVAGLPVCEIATPGDTWRVPPRCLPVLQVGSVGQQLPPFGAVSGAAGRQAGDCVVWAARAALDGHISGMVTAPLHKEALAAAGAPYAAFAGHTELLQAEAATHAGRRVTDLPVRMMLANDELRVVLVSIHVSMRDAVAAVTSANVAQTIAIAHAALVPMLGRAPRIAVAGLNPHAGEGGRFGQEEIEAIAPGVAAARAAGSDAHGPYAPDTVFMRARRGEFDVVIAMYHDQGLIPVKYLGVEQGVNVTLGLPLVRTSPDHGTAFDIAGKGLADPSSLVQAVRMARRIQLASEKGAESR